LGGVGWGRGKGTECGWRDRVMDGWRERDG